MASTVAFGSQPILGPLPRWVRGVHEFQQAGIVNKALVDMVGIDVPQIVLAKNPMERQERFFRQGLIFVLAFVLAPLHAYGFAKLVSRANQLPADVFRVSFKDLANVRTLKQALSQASRSNPAIFSFGRAQPINEALRQRLTKAKTQFLTLDLITECVLSGCVGPLKVLFGTKLTGKKQFTGEHGIVSAQTLDQLYAKADQERNKTQTSGSLTAKALDLKTWLPIGLGVILPLLIGGLIRRQYSRPFSNTHVSASRLNRWVRALAPTFDYTYAKHLLASKRWGALLNKVPLASDAFLVAVGLTYTLGDLAAARSHREFKELFIQHNAINVMYFLGTPLWMKTLTHLMGDRYGLKHSAISVGRVLARNQLPPTQRGPAARFAALAYLSSFVFNLLVISGVIATTNRMTRAAVKEDAKALPTSNT